MGGTSLWKVERNTPVPGNRRGNTLLEKGEPPGEKYYELEKKKPKLESEERQMTNNLQIRVELIQVLIPFGNG